MKPVRFFSVFLCILLLLPVCTSCSRERHKLLYEVEQNGLTFCARGKGDRVKQIVVKENGKVVWSTSVQTDKNMGKIDDAYGFLVQDLNFDGYNDILIAVAKDGDRVSYECYLHQGSEMNYVLHEELSALYNVRADADLEAVFAFEQSSEAIDTNAYVSCDKTVMYVWENGKLAPSMYAAIYRSSENVQKPYRFAVAYYDEELRDFLDSTDKWLTKEEYEAQDWGFLYYFK